MSAKAETTATTAENIAEKAEQMKKITLEKAAAAAGFLMGLTGKLKRIGFYSLIITATVLVLCGVAMLFGSHDVSGAWASDRNIDAGYFHRWGLTSDQNQSFTTRVSVFGGDATNVRRNFGEHGEVYIDPATTKAGGPNKWVLYHGNGQ